MGSGGMIVLDEDDCMVDIAKFFLTFSQDESCGKCTPCREGTTRMLEILERITAGNGVLEDLDKLEAAGPADASRRRSAAWAARRRTRSSARWSISATSTWPTSSRSSCPAHKCSRSDPLRDQPGEVRRLHGLRAELPGRRASPAPQGAARHRPAPLHQVRPVFRGLPV